MIEGIRVKGFYQHLKNLFARIRSFPGLLVKQLWYYAIAILVAEAPNNAIIHRGCNEIGNIAATEQSVAKSIMD